MRMSEEFEGSAISRLPPRLQEEFFELAGRAARRVAEELRREKERILELRKHLRFRSIPKGLAKDLRVGAVDGSSSPRLSERLGYRIGVYTGCYMVFDGGEVISDDDEESMAAGYIMTPQTGSSLYTRKLLSLMRTLLERDLALKCMEKYDVDLMIIDGSFYGFRARCSEIKEKEFLGLGSRIVGWELVREVYEKSKRLLDSGKAIGVIKRIRTAAIDGWLLSRNWRMEETLNKNDRSLLRSLMRYGEYFDYRDLLGDRWSYLHYNGLKGWFKEVKRIIKDLPEDRKLEKALGHVDKKLRTQIITDLAPKNSGSEIREEIFREVIGVRRIYVRLSPYAPPTCIELGRGVDLESTLAYLMENANLATGLPFPLDLVDANVSVDRRIAREFADEVEARLLLDHELNAEDVHGEFISINPQKEE